MFSWTPNGTFLSNFALIFNFVQALPQHRNRRQSVSTSFISLIIWTQHLTQITKISIQTSSNFRACPAIIRQLTQHSYQTHTTSTIMGIKCITSRYIDRYIANLDNSNCKILMYLTFKKVTFLSLLY